MEMRKRGGRLASLWDLPGVSTSEKAKGKERETPAVIPVTELTPPPMSQHSPAAPFDRAPGAEAGFLGGSSYNTFSPNIYR
jgi:hypothetical protein